MTLALHTGVPGSGKSLCVVDSIEHMREYKGRPVYAHAVDGWERAVQVCCTNPGCRTCRGLTESQRSAMHCINDWFEWIPTGALLVVDEAHYPFPSRREREMPMSVQRLTEHRHDGVDIWLCTPNANLVDINVRRLVEQHKHFVKGRLGRYVYTHSECMATDEALKAVKRERWKLPTRSYKFYKSADAHVTIKAELPKVIYRIPLLIAAALGLVWFSLDQASNLRRSNAPAVSPPLAGSSVDLPPPPSFTESPLRAYQGGLEAPSGASPRDAVDWSVYDREGFRPRVPLFPESAPVYDTVLREGLVAPAFAGCMAYSRESSRQCRCFDSSGGVLDVGPGACEYIADGGSRENWLKGDRARKRSGARPPSVPSL